jgi:hypothetical protein
MRQPGAQRAGAPRVKVNGEAAGIPATPSVPQGQSNEPLVHPSAADIQNELLAKAALAPEAKPGVMWGVSWLFFRDAATRLLAVRAISAEELQRAPFPETRGRA